MKYLVFGLNFKNISVVIFTDDGSDCSLITELAAGFLDLTAKKELITMQSGTKEAETKWMNVYKLKLPLNNGDIMYLRLIGVDKITENSTAGVNVKKAYKLFPHIPDAVFKRLEKKRQC